MFRQALSEVRLHPGRFVSTLLAIAISVAFLAGSAVLVATEGQAQGKAMNVSLSEADVVVTLPQDKAPRGVAAALAATPGVAASSPLMSSSEVVTAGLVSQALQLVNVPPESMRWAKLTGGRWPTAATDVALSAGAAGALGVKLGDSLKIAGVGNQLTVVGLTNEPSGLFAKTGYASTAYFAQAGLPVDTAARWAVKAIASVSATDLASNIRSQLIGTYPGVKTQLAEQVRTDSVAKLASDFDVFSNVLWGFATISLVVGMITIANTFSITLAQRRRQIGLLRAVGASGNQVRGRFLTEAALLGVIGSLLGLALGIGLAAGVTAWSTALFWGLSLPTTQLLIAVGLGVLATVVAAFVPILRGTKVLPLEALQPELSSDDRRRATAWRAVVCGLLVLAGGVLSVISVTWVNENALLIAIGAGALISAGVLFGGPLFTPALLKVTGQLFRWTGPVARLAADNAERNPRRATTTATALMLAVGLMVTLQVATASIRATVLDQLQVHYPVDVQVTWTGTTGLVSIPADTASRLSQVDGVDGSVALDSGQAVLGKDQGVLLLGYDPAIPAVTGVTTGIGADEVLVNEYAAEDLPTSVMVEGPAGERKLTVTASRLVDSGQAMVSAANLAAITKPVTHSVMWLSVPDRGQAITVMVAVANIAGSSERVSGSLAMAALYEQVLNILLAITTGLLAVAVLIALIGVSNTLGLSVLERTRESALLRALGLQASSLRAMLTIEALQVTLVGVLVGVAAGAFFGWMAAAATGNSAGFGSITFAVDIPQTLAMIAIAMAAAALASVLPGRRAAKAVPTEALADI
jgi:putative ABC transport system permease protein